MNKNKFIFILILISIISAIVFYYNSDKIISYFENKEWEIADSIGSVSLTNYTNMEGTLSNLIVIGSNFITGYSHEVKEQFDLFISFQDVVSDSAGDYCIVGEKNGTSTYMICGSEKIWENNVTGSIYDVYVNKNGYAAIIYKQSGYKSLVKIVTPTGEELFTSYLASTYALDVSITNDNKTLAIAEVNTDGIHVESTIKIIDINNLENKDVKRIDLDQNSLIVDIEFNNKNELLIMTDSKFQIVQNGVIKDILSYNYSNTINAIVENKENFIVVSKEEAGLFDIKYKLGIYSYGEEIVKKEYELYDLPKHIKASNNVIALAMEDELLVLNTNGKVIKKCDISRNVKSIVICHNDDIIALVYRDKIEFIKI